ncbi:outer membrane protein assembly factor BamA [Loktanella sp. D2R18]|uniref:outer membrane protein assembly factor BamA n=1 Tax=Rhodobacterales TaxID=204455 RepID=UPI000DE962D8|nr:MULTISPECIES: outer membrane protein assembly factor BamA [Rhodobacterales]MDO6589571.1 outer membrane protein assembly factor BamA [Yoonia sp. 1_MG-2023]RBW44212.1 outer membrane protein assembly factor BamA [Loktanella sp. D2R18]
MHRFVGRLLAQGGANMRRIATIAVIATFTAGAAFAQSFVFNNVSIEGNQRVADGTILTYAGISQGEALSTAELNDAAQAIRESGLFESVEVVPSGSTLIIRVVEYPTINRINVEGNARLSDSELLPFVQSQPRRAYNPTQAESDTAAITAAYAEQGRINATITPSIIPLSDNRVDLVFVVTETAVTEVERISFLGNRTYSESRLQRVLDTKQAGALRALIRRDTYSSERLAADRELLTDFYHSRGYPDFVVQNVDVALTRERDAYLITYNLREGQKFEFGTVTVASEIDGLDPTPFQDAIRVRQGVTYSPVPIETDIVRLERLAVSRGVNFVQVDTRITRNPRDLTLDLTYVLVPGPRIFVERIDIEGNSTTLDRVIRNRVDVVEGDPFNPREIRDSASRIRALGFFQDVSVNTRQGSSENQQIVDVDVVEGPTGSLSFGANYNSDTGIGLVASYNQSNFQGRGQSLSFNLSTAETNRNLSFSFAEPRLLGRDLRLGVNLSYATTDNESALYDTESLRISPRLTFPVSENGRLTVLYAFDYSDISDVDSSASQIIHNEADEGGVATHSFGYTYSYDTRRSGLNPTAGVVLRFGQEFGFGDAQFIKSTALLGAEAKVLNEEVTLRATLEGGYLDYQEGSSRVTDRFFMGSSVMRGFESGGIGPRDDDTDDALGGNAYAVLRLESEFPLGLPTEYGLTGGAFIDYGSVWNVGETYGEDVIYDEFTPRAVAGLSLFWTTPIGPLRFNFTEALDAQDRDDTKAFDVTISTSF